MPYEKSASGVYKSDTFTIERKADTSTYLEDKYTFKDKHGNWIIYNADGRPVSSGTEPAPQPHICITVMGTPVPQALLIATASRYSGLITMAAATSYASMMPMPGEVRYDYNGGRLIRVTDVLGNETSYEYSNGNLVKKTNAEAMQF